VGIFHEGKIFANFAIGENLTAKFLPRSNYLCVTYWDFIHDRLY